MSTLIILEGPDGAGKSTLAKKLGEVIGHGTKIVHHGPYHGESGQEIAIRYLTSIEDFILNDKDVILDRSWISEQVYGIAYRCGLDRMEPYRDDVESVIGAIAKEAGFKVLVVFCVPPWETVKANFEARVAEEYLSGLGPLRVVYDAYAAGNLTKLRSITVNPFGDPPDDIINVILTEVGGDIDAG